MVWARQFETGNWGGMKEIRSIHSPWGLSKEGMVTYTSSRASGSSCVGESSPTPAQSRHGQVRQGSRASSPGLSEKRERLGRPAGWPGVKQGVGRVHGENIAARSAHEDRRPFPASQHCPTGFAAVGGTEAWVGNAAGQRQREPGHPAAPVPWLRPLDNAPFELGGEHRNPKASLKGKGAQTGTLRPSHGTEPGTKVPASWVLDMGGLEDPRTSLHSQGPSATLSPPQPGTHLHPKPPRTPSPATRS